MDKIRAKLILEYNGETIVERSLDASLPRDGILTESYVWRTLLNAVAHYCLHEVDLDELLNGVPLHRAFGEDTKVIEYPLT